MNAVVRHRKSPRGWKSYALGAAAVAALLATTACEPGSDGASGDGKSSDRPTATATSSSKPGDGESTEGDGGTGLCAMKDLTFAAQNYDADGEPVRHLLIVATNAGDKKCDLVNYPEVTLGDAQGPAPVKPGTDSGEPVTLAPGDEAYAGLLATGGKMDTYDVKSMKITLGSPGGETEAEPAIDLPMPVTTFPADDGQRITHWAATEGLAMRPVTSS
ncbi:DUF4232 domain-containing protein [Streptomyces sp. NPDC050418]|uniref:DUF4232 domain-containing protein n=1 Tax=Streptomyces sp. NPDC050418 TaxID=3365612 RepID=UPI0037A19445